MTTQPFRCIVSISFSLNLPNSLNSTSGTAYIARISKAGERGEIVIAYLRTLIRNLFRGPIQLVQQIIPSLRNSLLEIRVRIRDILLDLCESRWTRPKKWRLGRHDQWDRLDEASRSCSVGTKIRRDGEYLIAICVLYEG